MNILYEDNHLIAVTKPAGVLTHSDITKDNSMTDEVKLYIKNKYNKPGDVFLNPVHRIDRPTSGLLLFAKTSKATSRMTKLFKERAVQKKYLAIVSSKPQDTEGKLINYLIKNEKTNRVSTINKEKGKRAVLTYQLSSIFKNRYLLSVYPETGRSHQIRVQLASMGTPIIGDLKYGSTIKTDGRSIGLHAYKLEFIHPVKKDKISITSPLPDKEMWQPFKGTAW